MKEKEVDERKMIKEETKDKDGRKNNDKYFSTFLNSSSLQEFVHPSSLAF